MKTVGHQPNQRSVPASYRPPGGKFTRDTRDRLVRLAFRFLWNRDDAEDAVQDALTRSLEHRNELRSEDKWWSWISSIVVRKCHELGRKRKTKNEHLARIQSETASSTVESSGEFNVEHHVIKSSLVKLPRRQREVIVLRHLELMSYEQIGELLGLSPSTVRVHARNGLESLRKMLKD